MSQHSSQRVVATASARLCPWPPLAAALACACALLLGCNTRPKEGPSAEATADTPVANQGAAVHAAPAGKLPGAAPLPPAVQAKLDRALAARGPGYVPRTRHRAPDGAPTYANRLLLERSPYLQQHAHNPVNWYPWGEEAFADARRLGRPILLSVGYSTCHWCHVMEEESFEDEEIAAYLNTHYVAIKVDREERPDIDSIYMTALQMITGSGGWPMTMWLTADGAPFHGASYLPPRAGVRGARLGFLETLSTMKAKLGESPETLAHTSKKLTEILREAAQPQPGELDPATVTADAAARYRDGYDEINGGLRVGARGSKFPSSLPIRFLLQHGARTGDARLIQMATFTLEKMARGGIYDQLGGGFHRYATDERWLVPHFEKMLYDNALLVPAYLDAWQLTGDRLHEQIARETLAYLARELSSPDGGFYSATDADSLNLQGTREEGIYFSWRPEELTKILGNSRGAAMARLLGIDATGNLDGRSVATLARDPAPAERAAFDRDRETLRVARALRPAPLRDDKILAAWNGLAMSAFARGGLILQEPDFTARAVAAARFVRDQMFVDGALRRVFHGGAAYTDAVLDDHAFVLAGFLDVFEASGDPTWLAAAVALEREITTRFADESGAYFFTAHDAERLLAREVISSDGALPSGLSVLLRSQLRLHEFSTDDAVRQRAHRALAAVASAVLTRPTAHGELLRALEAMSTPTREVVLVASRGEQLGPLLRTYARSYAPNTVLVATASPETVARHAPIAAGKRALQGRPTAYVCEGGHCELPTTSAVVFARLLTRQRDDARGKDGQP